MSLDGNISIKERDDDEEIVMKLSEEKELKKFLKGEKVKLVKQFYRSSAVYRMLVINLGCSSQGVDAKYVMSRKRKNLMQIARNSLTLLKDFSTRVSSSGKITDIATNDLVCCFEYLLRVLKMEYYIQRYMQSQKFRDQFVASNQILLIKTGLPVQTPPDKKFGIKYLIVKNFELSAWIQKDIKELEEMIESARNTSLVKPWDIAPETNATISAAFSEGLALQALQLIPVGRSQRNKKRKLIIIGCLLLLLTLVLSTSLSLTR